MLSWHLFLECCRVFGCTWARLGYKVSQTLTRSLLPFPALSSYFFSGNMQDLREHWNKGNGAWGRRCRRQRRRLRQRGLTNIANTQGRLQALRGIWGVGRIGKEGPLQSLYHTPNSILIITRPLFYIIDFELGPVRLPKPLSVQDPKAEP